ncbi:RE1 [Symbiodinium sp. CCMP2592]|nr:RE1 [Symbiodinium sp. CCMP2592]
MSWEVLDQRPVMRLLHGLSDLLAEMPKEGKGVSTAQTKAHSGANDPDDLPLVISCSVSSTSTAGQWVFKASASGEDCAAFVRKTVAEATGSRQRHMCSSDQKPVRSMANDEAADPWSVADPWGGSSAPVVDAAAETDHAPTAQQPPVNDEQSWDVQGSREPDATEATRPWTREDWDSWQSRWDNWGSQDGGSDTSSWSWSTWNSGSWGGRDSTWRDNGDWGHWRRWPSGHSATTGTTGTSGGPPATWTGTSSSTWERFGDPSTTWSAGRPTAGSWDGWQSGWDSARHQGASTPAPATYKPDYPAYNGSKGPSERLIVPTFTGESEGNGDLGTSARSYLRQVSAWEKMTKLAPDERALVLYQHLSGSAWVNSESLNVEELARPDGVDRLREWIRQHYLDVEVTQVGRSLSDLFRKLRRRPQQSFRDYAAEFNRLLARVLECGCALPDVANAWLFVDRANLDESTEVSLLASVGNKYALKALQSAAIVLDRSMRKPWEKTGFKPRTQSVNQTEDVEMNSDSEVEEPLLDDPAGHSEELYLSKMTAKARYKEVAKARGIDYKGTEKDADASAIRKAAEAKIQLAKSKSHCSACGQKGHWHKDTICPKHPGGKSGTTGGQTQTIHVTNEVYELVAGVSGGLQAILDSACSKTVVGTAWLQKYLDYVKDSGYDVIFVYEKESFRFGAASRIYESTYAAVILVPMFEHIVAVKAAVIHGDIPLLMSKPALSRLGLILDLGNNAATFRALQDGEVQLCETASGHPAIVVDHSKLAKPDTSCFPDHWEPHGVAIVRPREVYMTACSGALGDDHVCPGDDSGVPKIFYDKKLDSAVKDMLTDDVLNEELFATWWASTEITSLKLYLLIPLCAMLPVWKMNKSQLMEECRRRGLAIGEKWTCPELRTVILADKEFETKNKGQAVPKGLSSMSLQELKDEAMKMELEVRTNDTKGSLMLRIRDAGAPSDTVMTIGRFRGTTFAQIPENYGDWASEEERRNGDNMHNDLKRFVQWRRHRRSRAKGSASSVVEPTAPSYLDVETYAMVTPPPDSTGEVLTARHCARGNAQDHPGEALARAALEAGDFSFDTATKILQEYNLKPSNHRRDQLHGDPDVGGRCNLGYYAYGTFKGISRKTTTWPMLTRFLNGLLAECSGPAGPDQPRAIWTSLALLGNCPTAVHTDKNNLKGSQQRQWGRPLDPRARWRHLATKQEKKILHDLGFPAPTKAELRDIRKRDLLPPGEENNPKDEGHASPSSKPIRSQRKNLRRAAMMLSVLFTTALSTMHGAAQAVLPFRSTPETALLEVGGLSATCRLAEYGVCDQHLLEPLLTEDVLYNDHPQELGIGYIEAMSMRHQPGQLWIHMRPEWGQTNVYNDLVEAVSYQLGEGRAVVFEKEVEDPTLWDGLTNGWEDAGYEVSYDFTEDGHQYLRVIQAAPENYAHTVYLGENETDEELLPVSLDPEGQEDTAPIPRGAQAISFPPSVSETIASSLRRLHQNLGHPSTTDFVRHLRLAGASRDVLKAARSLECQVCARTKHPAIPKPAKIAPCYRCNEMVGTDLFYVHDSEGRRHQLLSIVDFSSAYQVVVPVAKKDTATLEKAFCASWIQVFGAPSVVAVDLENGLEKSLARIGDWTGTKIRSAAGQAHHQAGFVERQGAVWKAVFSRICEECSVCQADFHLAVGAVSTAKNQLTRISGFSPSQHVFGSAPGLPEDLLEGPHAGDPEDAIIVDDKHAREVALRTAARSAYFHVQTDERVRRALAGRARVEDRVPECGERVFYYRKTKNNKKGCWIGPGTVIGRDGYNLWVTRAGRCVLCAPEHVRLATAEELGQAFSMRVAQEDLDRLLNADSDAPGVFDGDDGGEDEEMVNIEAGGIGEVAFDMEEEPEERRGLRRDLVRVPPRVLKRQRRKGRGEEALADDGVNAVHMIKKAKTPRSREKQLEKEMPWNMIPDFMRPAFREKEMVQWNEHVDTGALEVLSVQESEEVRRTEHPSRILTSRFAYRDKHLGRRRANPDTPWKPKSRLVVGGHQDPDVGIADIAVDSPTVSRASLISLLQICASKRWKAAAGDVQAAFLQGVELSRRLWVAQPKSGIQGLDPRQIARIRKGVFGLSESPRMWYDRLSSVLLGEVFDLHGVPHRLVPSPLDPCVMMLLENGQPGEPKGYLAMHVDDILVLAPTEINRMLQGRINQLFPIDGWLEDSFEYVGSFIKVDDDGVSITQAGFADGRLFSVDVPRAQRGTDPATEEQTIDNRSLLGALSWLSWLSSQSRPDLLCGVALSQQLQRAPLTEDVRFPKRGSSKVASQLGHLILLSDRGIVNGHTCKASLLEWRSQSCKRVCRSTFGAETMSAVEGLEGGQYMRALRGSLLCGRLVKHEEIRGKWPILCLSDCKSLHDHLHKAGTPRLPADRRLAIDLAALRQELRFERWGSRLPLQWIPTAMQLADPLTKPMRTDVWWKNPERGHHTSS